MTGISKPKNKFFKLLKNDFLASARVISLFYIAIIALLVVFGVCAALQGNESISFELAEKISKARNVSIIISILVSFLLIFVTFYFVVNDFFKSLFSPQGYLSFTLPVSSNQLLGSKVIVYGGWMILSYATFFFTSVYLMNYTADQVIGMEKISLIESFLAMMGNIPSTTQIIAYAVYMVMTFFAMFLSFLLIIYFSITLSHVRLLQKHSKFFSVLLFFVTAAVFLMISFKMSDIVNFVLVFNEDKTLSFGVLSPTEYLVGNKLGMEVTPVFSFFALDIALFFATSYIMHKKVNLK